MEERIQKRATTVGSSLPFAALSSETAASSQQWRTNSCVLLGGGLMNPDLTINHTICSGLSGPGILLRIPRAASNSSRKIGESVGPCSDWAIYRDLRLFPCQVSSRTWRAQSPLGIHLVRSMYRHNLSARKRGWREPQYVATESHRPNCLARVALSNFQILLRSRPHPNTNREHPRRK